MPAGPGDARCLPNGSVDVGHVREHLEAVREIKLLVFERDVVENANREIRETIGERSAVVVGSWAPEFAFDTPYQFYYVRSELNSSKKRLRRLGITHLLLMNRRDFSGRVLRREFSNLGSRIREQTSFVYRGRKITLHAVKRPPLT